MLRITKRKKAPALSGGHGLTEESHRGADSKANCFNNSDFCASREKGYLTLTLLVGQGVGEGREADMEAVIRGQSGERERVAQEPRKETKQAQGAEGSPARCSVTWDSWEQESWASASWLERCSDGNYLLALDTHWSKFIPWGSELPSRPLEKLLERSDPRSCYMELHRSLDMMGGAVSMTLVCPQSWVPELPWLLPGKCSGWCA